MTDQNAPLSIDDIVVVYYDALPRISIGKVIECDNAVRVRLFLESGELSNVEETASVDAIVPITRFSSGDPPLGLALSKGSVVFQSVGGIFQLAEVLHDVPEGETLATLRLYVGPRESPQGLVTPTPLDAIITPHQFVLKVRQMRIHPLQS
ncbi:MAG TPA: hypothetical protein VFE16_13720 [Candidatus Cybelea sp.]|jgi:hypothetical protein|nr:hypothetical protein [Candidatus Cybelea sp.]